MIYCVKLSTIGQHLPVSSPFLGLIHSRLLFLRILYDTYTIYNLFIIKFCVIKESNSLISHTRIIIFSLNSRTETGNLIHHSYNIVLTCFFLSLARLTFQSLALQLTSLSEGDREALGYILKASIVIDDIFYEQVHLSTFFIFF